MTKLEYVLSGKGNKQQRCLCAAFCIGHGSENGWSEEIAKYYDKCYDEIVFPHVAMDIIKHEYGKRVDNLTPKFIHDLLVKMIDIDSDSSICENEIWEEIENFMNS